MCNYPDCFCFWLLSLVLLFYSSGSWADPTAFSCNQVTDISQSECEALVAFYNQTAGEHWLNHSGWLSDTTAANWYGVTVTNNQITELTLDDNHLVGTLPLELCQLSQLQVLHLGHDNPESTNQLSGEIPACLGQLSQLKRLSLANNTLSGSIPETLCQLTQLQYLDLSANELINGLIPSCLGANLSQLRSLNLQQLSLSGAIPTSLCQLTSLQALRLQSNQLSGAIPSCLGQLNQLVILWLYHNQLNGTIPPELCQLSALEYLGLGRNQLSGAIPACLGESLSKLQILYLSYNQLTGAMPATLGQLTALRQLYLDNNQLVGPFPEALVDMASSNTDFIQFHLDNNWLGYGECQPVQRLIARGGWVDTIPGWFDGGLVHSPQKSISDFEQYCPPLAPTLTITKVGSGTVSGEGIDCGDDCAETYEPNQTVTLTAIPEPDFEFTVWGGDCSGTESTITFSMDAHKNCLAHFNQPASFICTDVPPNECDALVTLYQQTGGESWTNKSGWLTEMSASKWYGITVTNGHVTEVRLSKNQLVGKLPTEICQLSQLQQLNLGEYRSGNRLIGEIPICLGELSELQLLTLASNEFSGEIPPQLGQLSQLITLDLRDNPLEGSLPETLCELTRLENLYLGVEIDRLGYAGRGKLGGSIPNCFGNLLNLKKLDLYFSQFAGEIPTSLCQLVNLQDLDLSVNYLLSGEIPACLGELTNLTNLSFYVNKLTGSIPIELCHLSHLNTLSLDRNQLSGEIPDCLQDLTLLGSLSLFSNRFTGHIPTAICNLTQLYHLRLEDNQLEGKIPTCIGNQLLNLRYLYLRAGGFTGQLPSSFGNLINLRNLHLSSNKLDNQLPDEFVNMVFANPNLVRLSLQYNHFNSQDCRALQILRSRGKWDIFNHSPQNNGFDFEVDCAALSLHVLTVTKTGDGSGTITGDGINCGTDCVDAYQANTQITLTATPDANSIFTGWIGNCQGTDITTTFTLTGDQTCNAQFELQPLCQRVTDIESAECEALVAFYQGSDGDNWNNHDGWLTATTVNDWHGVTVHDGQVTELHLENNQLVGTLPTVVCQLSHLEKLTLNTNQLSGTLPACLGSLTQLDLHDNAFTSPLTEDLIQTIVSNLQLRQLNLAHNQLGLPDCTAIQTLKQRGD
ncbi:MAG: hypothetical protein HC877_14875 [Thioploca sp.]|nr:hypothetical protein [Thioploca sp.]